ncbi:BatD family protein [Vibrio sp. SCSIO 43135]|uniref:BatD family protein n=1 Tax=Vibrio sp. SCSIO 43135 TaxID=2819096 RepID=UPI0020759596|nr:BatD family protein [Vibrio sp. SCSIO 43135]USD42699.1 BatD family protein [Vibrio sp. SCSIO 43135]
MLNRICRSYFLPVLVGFGLLFSGAVHAASSFKNDTVKDSKTSVELSAWVGDKAATSPQTFTVKEQIILSIDVGTPRWFTSGTRIGGLEMADVIVKQRNPMATNYTERRQGNTWSKQRWELTLYPQKAGQYTIAPIAVEVTVSLPSGQSKNVTLYTKPMTFEVTTPSGMIAKDEAWLNASSVEVSQQWQTSTDDLKVGQAITRTVTLKADDTLSILIPQMLSLDSQDSYQTYVQPTQFDDRQERGNYRSERIEQQTYVLQQGGEIEFPAIELKWWNSDKQQLELVTIEGKTVEVSHTLSSWLSAYWLWLVCLGVLTFGLIVGFFVARNHIKTHGAPEWWTLRVAIKSHRWSEARVTIYRKLRLQHQEVELAKHQDNELWQAESQALQSGSTESKIFVSLWRNIKRKSVIKRTLIPKALKKLNE